MKRVTLSDVARHAGVSKATVSMVLNGDSRVALTTRVRVQESLTGLGYIYDRTAASLRKPLSQAVGMIVTQLTNPYFAEFAEGIQAELDARGMDVLLGVSGEDPERQARLLRSMWGRQVDGVVLIPAHGTTAANMGVTQMPILLLARRVAGVEADYVGGDNVNGAFAAVEHLIDVHGCTCLAFVGGFADSSARAERLEGFSRSVAAHGLTVPSSRKPACAPTRQAAREEVHRLLGSGLRDRPDGILCFNDVVALGVLDALAELSLRPGVDVRVFGFDDVQAAAGSRPSLASVSVPAHTAGRHAAEMLLGRVHGQRHEYKELVLAAELRPRETCGCVETTRTHDEEEH